MNVKETLSKSFWLTKKIDGQEIQLLYEPICLCNRNYSIFALYNVKKDNKIIYKTCLDIYDIKELKEKSGNKNSDVKLEI